MYQEHILFTENKVKLIIVGGCVFKEIICTIIEKENGEKNENKKNRKRTCNCGAGMYA